MEVDFETASMDGWLSGDWIMNIGQYNGQPLPGLCRAVRVLED